MESNTRKKGHPCKKFVEANQDYKYGQWLKRPMRDKSVNIRRYTHLTKVKIKKPRKYNTSLKPILSPHCAENAKYHLLIPPITSFCDHSPVKPSPVNHYMILSFSFWHRYSKYIEKIYPYI